MVFSNYSTEEEAWRADFLGIIKNVKVDLEVHLLGQISMQYKDQISDLLKGKHKLSFHSLVPSEQLSEKISEYDIGLALELDSPLSRPHSYK